MSLHKKHLQNLFNLYYIDLCKKSYSYIHDVDKAKDIVQDVFLALLEKIRLDHISDLKSYIYKSVINASIKQAKKQKTADMLNKDIELIVLSKENDSTEHTSAFLKSEKEILKELDLLPDKCKKVFILCVLEDMKYQVV
ncbi:RNA polymerase sigma factor [Galbibacter pacificus]|uniref:RNA polymerase sigma factor n=1 Tax=Galbibacter pacificus TaxID=2996052 RepID=UPI0038B31F0B